MLGQERQTAGSVLKVLIHHQNSGHHSQATHVFLHSPLLLWGESLEEPLIFRQGLVLEAEKILQSAKKVKAISSHVGAGANHE